MSLQIELQTDVVRRETGADSIYAHVFEHAARRRAILYAVKGDKRQAQTIVFATLHRKQWPMEVRTIDGHIQAGAPMGEAFRRAGLRVRQNRLLLLPKVPLPARCAAVFGLGAGTRAEMEVYDFFAGSCRYATVVEIKSPHRLSRPARPALGWWRLQTFGTTSSRAVKLLDSRQPMGTRLILARLCGVALALVLMCRTYARPFTTTEFSLLEQNENRELI